MEAIPRATLDKLAKNTETLAINALALNTVDPKRLQAAQQDRQELANHLAGQHPRGVIMGQVALSPGIELWCNVADKANPKPFVPSSHHPALMNFLHQPPRTKRNCQKVSSEIL